MLSEAGLISDLLWKLAPFSRVRIADFGEELVAFDAGSGATHAIDPIAAYVLECIRMRPRDVGALARLVSEHFDLPDDATLMSYLGSLLRSLGRNNLIQPFSK